MWKRALMIFSLLILSQLSYTEECPIIPHAPQFERSIEGYDGKYLNLKLDSNNIPVLSFYDTISSKLYLLHPNTDGVWEKREIDSGEDILNSLMVGIHPIVIYAKGGELYKSENGVNSLISSYNREIKGLSSEMAEMPIISFYLLSADHSEWELKMRKGESEIVIDGGTVNESLKRGDIISALSTAIFINGTNFRLIYTDLSYGYLKECILSSELQIQETEKIYFVPSSPFSAQWIKKFSEGEVFGVAFYNSMDSKLMVASNKGGVWSVFTPLGTRTGIGMYPAPVLLNGKLKIFGFDSSFGFVSLIEEKDYGFIWKRIDGKKDAGRWCAAVPFSSYDIIFAFSVPEADRIEVHYLSDY